MDSNIYLYLFIVVVSLLVLKIILSYKKEEYPYYKNSRFLSPAEISFFNVLQQVVDKEKYYIFCQVSIGQLLKVNKRGKEWWQYFNKINRKAADFVICSKNGYTPLLIIELDDSSHHSSEAREKDGKRDQMFEAAELPLIRFTVKSGYSIAELKSKINSKGITL